MKKSIHWAINEYPTMPLRGCVPDLEKMVDKVGREGNFMAHQMRLACDSRCTTAKMHEHMQWMCEDIEPGDLRVVTYSGHGTQYAGRGKDQEIDGLLEVLVPYDFNWQERFMFTDKEIYKYNKIMAEKGALLWEFFDCCNSGDISREVLLPPAPNKHPLDNTDNRRNRGSWKFKGSRVNRTLPMPIDVRHRVKGAKDKGFRITTPADLNITVITGCRSNQFSADMTDANGVSGGAMTDALIKYWNSMHGEKVDDIVAAMNRDLDSMALNQNPQLEGLRKGITILT